MHRKGGSHACCLHGSVLHLLQHVSFQFLILLNNMGHGQTQSSRSKEGVSTRAFFGIVGLHVRLANLITPAFRLALKSENHRNPWENKKIEKKNGSCPILSSYKLVYKPHYIDYRIPSIRPFVICLRRWRWWYFGLSFGLRLRLLMHRRWDTETERTHKSLRIRV